jgi:hypothetical protein
MRTMAIVVVKTVFAVYMIPGPSSIRTLLKSFVARDISSEVVFDPAGDTDHEPSHQKSRNALKDRQANDQSAIEKQAVAGNPLTQAVNAVSNDPGGGQGQAGGCHNTGHAREHPDLISFEIND